MGCLVFSIAFCGHAGELAKVFGEVALAVETTIQGNVCDRPLLVFSEQLLGPLHPLLNDVLIGGDAHGVAKLSAKVILTHAQ